MSGSVNLSASATDNTGGSGVASVAFLVDGTVVSTDTSSPYTATWDSSKVPNGSHTVVARATDVAGNVKDSASVSVTVQNTVADTTAPTVSVSAPVAGATVSGSVNLSASATDNTGGSGVASVAFLVDGTVVSTDTSSPYTATWDSSKVTNGSHTVVARATDVAGNVKDSASVSVTVQNTVADTTAPTVSVSAPVAGATVSGSVNLSASATDDTGGSGVASVAFLVDGTVVSTDTSSPYTATWDSSKVTNGSHTVVARATDVAGNVRNSASVSVTVQNGTSGGGGDDGGGNNGGGSGDTTAPTVSLTGVTAGATVNGSVNLSASAADAGSGVASVAFAG